MEKCSLETNTKKSKWYKFKFRKISNLDYLREPSLVAQTIMNLPANVGDLGLEDLLEKGMATHSSILAWKIPWTEESGRLQCMRLQRVGHVTELLSARVHAHTHTHTHEKLQISLIQEVNKEE